MAEPSDLIGYVDIINAAEIAGWACDRSSPSATSVDIYLNDEKLLTIPADQFRADLAPVISAEGRHAFRASIPSARLRAGVNTIEVRYAATDQRLPNGFLEPLVPESRLLALGLALQCARAGFWFIEDGVRHTERIDFHGWLVVSPGAATRALYEGERQLEATWTPDPGRRAAYGLPEWVQVESFTASIATTERDSPARISAGTQAGRFPGASDVLLPLASGPMPSAAQISRIAGRPSEMLYEIVGCTIADTIRTLCEEFSPKPLRECDVLEWGVGCGRVGRYLGDLTGSFSGCDIDGDNIDWCARHLCGDYRQCELVPPTTYADASFDVIYAISVLTHLSRENEALWLGELRRIARPGALLILTSMGARISMYGGFIEKYAAGMAQGHIDLGAVDHLDGVVESGYYRNVLHTEGYIFERWSAYFEILEHRPGAIGNLQDATILRRR